MRRPCSGDRLTRIICSVSMSCLRSSPVLKRNRTGCPVTSRFLATYHNGRFLESSTRTLSNTGSPNSRSELYRLGHCAGRSTYAVVRRGRNLVYTSRIASRTRRERDDVLPFAFTANIDKSLSLLTSAICSVIVASILSPGNMVRSRRKSQGLTTTSNV